MAALPTRREALRTSLLALAAPCISTSAISDSWAFDHVNVIDGSGSLLSDRTVLVDGNRIAAVDQSAAPRPLANAKRIDATGKYLMPGFWDMHVHLSYTKQSALPIMLANGITGVRDCGGLLRELDWWQAEMHVGALSGPQIVRSGPQVNGKVFAFTQIAVANAAEARGAVEALQIAGVDFIKVVAAISRDAYLGVAQECKALFLLFAGHIPRVMTRRNAPMPGRPAWSIS